MVEPNVEVQEDADDKILSDAKIFDPQNESLADESLAEFTVRDPVNTSGTVLYKITGRDKEGLFEGQRRYNEFFLLHETLRKRWPCIPIPCIPPKKNFGNKDLIFIQQRRYYLERFFRCVAKFDFIINSAEFKIFSRPNGMPIEKGLEKLPKLSVTQSYERIRESTKLDENAYDPAEREQFSNRIVEYGFFMKKTKPFLAQLKIDLASMLTNKADCIAGYKGLQKIYESYEDLNLSHYSEMNSSRLILMNPENCTLKESMGHLNANLRNGFVDIYHWVQGELYDLQAIGDAVQMRAEIEKQLISLQKKKSSTQKDIDTLQKGEKSVGTIFKNRDDVGGLTNQVESTMRDIQVTQQLLDLVTVYLGRDVIPSIKKEKLALYKRVAQQFHVIEISNNHQVASFWSSVLANESVKAATK